jgi:hypothetical protein
MTTTDTIKPAMRIRGRSVEAVLDPETGATETVTARIHYTLTDQTIETEHAVGDHGIIDCVGDRYGWRYSTSVHGESGVAILEGLAYWLPPLPAGWDIPAIEFAASLVEVEAVSA